MTDQTALLPPHNAEAEESVLGSLLLEPDLLPEISGIISPSDFYNAKHAWLFEAMLTLSQQAEPIDLLTVQAELERRGRLSEIGGPSCLTRLVTLTPSAYNAPAYARLVAESALRRRLIGAASATVKLAYENSADIERVISESNRAYLEAVSQRDPAEPTVRQLAAAAVDRYLNPEAMQANLLPLRLPSIDAALGGGLERKTQTVIMARPSVGKTAAMCQSADENAIAGAVVVVFTLEMSAAQIIDRMAARRARVNLLDYKRNPGPESKSSLVKAAADIGDMKNLFVFEKSLTVSQMGGRLARIARTCGRVDYIYIDHLRLIADRAERNENETVRLGRVSMATKQLARDYDAVTILLAQLSRAIESESDKRPDMHHLRQSGEIEENTDNAFGMYRERYYKPESASRIVEFGHAKVRNGERGNRSEMVFLEEYGLFGAVGH
jgi:replicative DNA helicase